MKRTAALSAAGATALLLSSLTPVSAVEPTVRIVDNDKVECPGAAYGSIKTAVKAANPGDTVQVCPGTYQERVTVDKTLTLQGATRGEAFDCFITDFSTLDPTQVSIIEPPLDAALDSLLSLTADNIDVSGFVFQKQKRGTSAPFEAALETDSGHSGYNIHDNIFYDNTFGVEFGSAGITQDSKGNAMGSLSTLQGNCLRNNRWALANQRLSLKDALITDNKTMNNTEKAYELGTDAAGVERVKLDDNTSIDDRVVVSLFSNYSSTTITGNKIINASAPVISPPPIRSIEIFKGATGLKITDNSLSGANVARAGIAFLTPVMGKANPAPVTGAEISDNNITGYAAAIAFNPNANSTDNLVEQNITSGNTQFGIFVSANSNRNTVKDNTADNNGTAGIQAQAGTSGNEFKDNSMHGNGSAGLAGMADAVDLSGNPLLNTWTDNSCTTDKPDGLCALP